MSQAAPWARWPVVTCGGRAGGQGMPAGTQVWERPSSRDSYRLGIANCLYGNFLDV
ncbi:UNVERIFIED_CONTAM: hypothetical protein Slati_2712100 [Sesamum latifolium]|uniref:Uncharacterized protein n=1 Tax=Sesamum latifolium TaxID=2727402 RepID=A0AAW2VXJ2_9LAMI